MPRVSTLVRTAEFLHAAGERPFGHFDHDAKNMQGPADRPSAAPPEPSSDLRACFEFTLDETGDVVGVQRVAELPDIALGEIALEDGRVLARDP